MKRQIFALIAGAALLAAPLMTNIAVADDMPSGGRGGRMERMAQKLNLSDSQKTQLKELRKATKAKIKAVLTPEQQAKLEAAKAERKQQWQEYRKNGGTRPQGRRKGKRMLFKQLNITEEQRAEMKRIRQEAKAARDNILTADQKAQLEQLKQQRRAQRQQRRNSQ